MTENSRVLHVMKTLALVDKVKEEVHVGLTCDVCGEIKLPPIPYDHIAAFATLLEQLHQQLQSPGFTYYPGTKKGDGLVETENELGEAIDHQNIISEVLKMSKWRKGRG